MKKFYNRKDLAKYLDASEQYVNDEISDYLGCEGSELFSNEEDISIEAFRHEGVKINDTMVYIASVEAEIDADYDYYEIYCIE